LECGELKMVETISDEDLAETRLECGKIRIRFNGRMWIAVLKPDWSAGWASAILSGFSA